MIQMLFWSHLLNLLLVVDSKVHFLDYSSLDSLSKPSILTTYTYSVFKIFNLNQLLDSRLICPTAYYITTRMCNNRAKSEPILI